MDKAFKIMLYAGWGLTLILIVVWPLLTLPAKVFSQGYFTFWVILSITWGIIGTVVGITLPFIESREAIAAIAKGIFCGAPASGDSTEVTMAQAAFPSPSFGKLDVADVPKA